MHQFLLRLDLARQATVLAVDEHNDQGRISFSDADKLLIVSCVKDLQLTALKCKFLASS